MCRYVCVGVLGWGGGGVNFRRHLLVSKKSSPRGSVFLLEENKPCGIFSWKSFFLLHRFHGQTRLLPTGWVESGLGCRELFGDVRWVSCERRQIVIERDLWSYV